MLSPLTYLNLNTNDLIFEKLNLSDKLRNKRDKNMITATSKSTTLVKGDRVKLPEKSLESKLRLISRCLLTFESIYLK